MPAQQLLISTEGYHKDRRISASKLKIFWRSPKDFYERFIQDPPRIVEPTPAMVLGSAVDCRVFTPDRFDSTFIVCRDGRTKEGKEDAARCFEAGLVRLTKDQYDKSKAMADAVLAEPVIAEMIADGDKQLAIAWSEFGLEFRMMCDLYLARPDQSSDLVLDLKTTDDPSPENWIRGGVYGPVPKFQYDLQLATYDAGLFQYTGRPTSQGFIVVGSAEPHDVYLYDLGGWLEIGRAKRKKAVEDYLRCLETGVWRREEQSTVIKLQPSQWDIPQE
jgi:hypothetical protein